MAADALSPHIARPSEAMVMNIQDERVIVFHKEGFQLPEPPNCCEMIEKNMIYFILK